MPKRTSHFREDLLWDLMDAAEAGDYIMAAQADSEQMLVVALEDIAAARTLAIDVGRMA